MLLMKYAYLLLFSYFCLKLRHPNIIAYKEAFFEDSTSSLCIVMEFADGGDLLERINGHKKRKTMFTEQELWRIFIQLVSGLNALHERKIFHRDMKVSLVSNR